MACAHDGMISRAAPLRDAGQKIKSDFRGSESCRAVEDLQSMFLRPAAGTMPHSLCELCEIKLVASLSSDLAGARTIS